MSTDAIQFKQMCKVEINNLNNFVYYLTLDTIKIRQRITYVQHTF